MHCRYFNHLCWTGWAERYEGLILSFDSPCCDQQSLTPLLEWEQFCSDHVWKKRFFMTVPVKEVLWGASNLCQRYACIVLICAYVMVAIEVMPHKVHDNPTWLRKWLEFWASSSVSAACVVRKGVKKIPIQGISHVEHLDAPFDWGFLVHTVWHQNDHEIQPWFHW